MINGNMIFYFFQQGQVSRVSARTIWYINGQTVWNLNERETVWTLDQC